MPTRSPGFPENRQHIGYCVNVVVVGVSSVAVGVSSVAVGVSSVVAGRGLVAAGKGFSQEETVNAVVRSAAVPWQRRGMPRLSALLISPHSERRQSWSRRLRGVGIGQILEAAGPEDAVARGRSATEHGVCLVEVAPQDASALQTIQELRRQGWDRLVLVTSKHDTETVRLALASRIRTLVVNTSTSGYAPGTSRGRGSNPENLELSEREVQVVQLVANGHTNRSVGEELNLSALTVKSHLSRIGRKLGTGNRAQIVATCMRARLIS